jgi:hypothetical protein
MLRSATATKATCVAERDLLMKKPDRRSWQLPCSGGPGSSSPWPAQKNQLGRRFANAYLRTSLNGVKIQVYLAMIASLLISLWIGKKPTLRTLEMLQFYFMGWATDEELQAHIAELKDQV